MIRVRARIRVIFILKKIKRGAFLDLAAGMARIVRHVVSLGIIRSGVGVGDVKYVLYGVVYMLLNVAYMFIYKTCPLTIYGIRTITPYRSIGTGEKLGSYSNFLGIHSSNFSDSRQGNALVLRPDV